MSSRTTTARIVSITMMALGATAIGTAAVIGWTGYPPVRAQAAYVETEAQVGTLGVVQDSVVELGEEVLADERMDEAVASAGTTASSGFAAPSAKRKAARPKKATVARGQMLVASRRPAGAGSGAGARASKGAAPRGRGWQSAKASWYGPGFYGNTMAGGGKLRRDSMVVAHRSLPFGTRIQFSYRGRTATAVVQDRGPFIHGRVFDLGPGTAKALGFGGVGIVKYRIL